MVIIYKLILILPPMSFSSKKEFELVLAGVVDFEKPLMMLEQYVTPASIAASFLWGMAMRDEVQQKVVVDAGCGPGIFGLGALLLGASKVYFVDVDPKVLAIAQKEYERLLLEYDVGDAVFVCSSIKAFSETVDVVIQNPPFGTKVKHADKLFLEKAFSIAPLVYSLHKTSTHTFVVAMAREFKFNSIEVERYAFPLRAQFAFHRKKIERVDVSLWRFEKR